MYPPRIQRVQHKVFKTVAGSNSPADDVKSLGDDPNDVKHIIVRLDCQIPLPAYYR